MNTILNLSFLIIFYIFLFYWFQNIIKKNKKYLYVPYSSKLHIPDNEQTDQQTNQQTDEQKDQQKDQQTDQQTEQQTDEANLIQHYNIPEAIIGENFIERNSIFENWENYL